MSDNRKHPSKSQWGTGVRKTIESKFSSVLLVEEVSGLPVAKGMERDPRLQRRIQQILKQYPDASEDFLAKYVLKQVLGDRPHKLDKGLLCAYLEETCFWVARQICQEYAIMKLSPLDCFGNARLCAANPGKIFAPYDFSSSAVGTYAKLRLKGATLDMMPEIGQQLCKHSKWRLLRELSRSRFQQALYNTGLSQPQISHILLVVDGFKQVYTAAKVKGPKQLPAPTWTQLRAIASYCNRSRGGDGRPVKASEAIGWLDIAVKAARSSAAVKVSSIDADEKLGAQLSYLDPEPEIDPDKLGEINHILADAFGALPPQGQKMLKLSHGEGLIQKKIGEIVGIKQCNVSRQIGKSKQVLLQALSGWSEENQGYRLTGEMSPVIDQWLQQFLGRE